MFVKTVVTLRIVTLLNAADVISNVRIASVLLKTSALNVLKILVFFKGCVCATVGSFSRIFLKHVKDVIFRVENVTLTSTIVNFVLIMLG